MKTSFPRTFLFGLLLFSSSFSYASNAICLTLQSDNPEVTEPVMVQALSSHTEVSAATDCLSTKNGRLTIALNSSKPELAVTYESGTGKSSTRVVEPAQTAKETIRLAASLAYSMVTLAGGSDAPKADPKPTQLASPPKTPAEPSTRWANVSLFYPLSTNMFEPDCATYFDLNLLYGRVGSVHGVQLGAVSVTTKNMRGIQASLLTNINHGKTEGLQVAPVNVAQDVTGLQVGPVNVAQDVTGMQLGLVNVARKVNGFSLGLISITEEGGVHPMLFASSDLLLNAGIRFATKYTYTGFLLGYNPRNNAGLNKNSLHAATLGVLIGASLPVASWFRFDADLGLNVGVAQDKTPTNLGIYQVKARALTHLRMAKHFGVFAGGAVSYQQAWDFSEDSPTVRERIEPEVLAGIEF